MEGSDPAQLWVFPSQLHQDSEGACLEASKILAEKVGGSKTYKEQERRRYVRRESDEERTHS